jgi:hypothetical protein
MIIIISLSIHLSIHHHYHPLSIYLPTIFTQLSFISARNWKGLPPRGMRHIDNESPHPQRFKKATQDYVASDMFTVLADNHSQYGVVIGFLSQKLQYGCIAVNKYYDRLSVHVSGI